MTLDGEVVNFFRVLRKQGGKLVRAIGLTPFSPRRVFARNRWAGEETAVRSGAGAPVPSRACPAGKNRTRADSLYRTLGELQGHQPGWYVRCRFRVGSAASRVCLAIATRLLRVQIENRPALEVVKLYHGTGRFSIATLRILTNLPRRCKGLWVRDDR